jgi:glycosyltransferase involved in cell wall biosynthesis
VSSSNVTALDAAPGCALSVVVGSIDAARSIRRSIASIEHACRGIDAEIIVVDASTDDSAAIVTASASRARVLSLPRGTLTPVLWSTGLAASRGRVVAFTTAHFEVEEGWARALLRELESGTTGAAGRFALSEHSTPVDWAMFFLRYSAFLGVAERGVQPAHEIPADNAAYRREALARHSASFGAGFWEVDFHRRIRAEGAQLAFVPGAEAVFGPSSSLGELVRQRYAHGCHSGGWRVMYGLQTAWRAAIAAPLVPAVLIGRIARRVFSSPAYRGRFVLALPALFVLAAAWAAGEARGALVRESNELPRTPGAPI